MQETKVATWQPILPANAQYSLGQIHEPLLVQGWPDCCWLELKSPTANEICQLYK